MPRKNDICGIYKITNIINLKVYIGQSTGIFGRKYNHFRELKKNIHENEYLQNAWNKDGEENFKHEILEVCSVELLDEREDYWIEQYDALNRDKGYNIVKDSKAFRRGIKLTQEEIDKLSKEYKLIDPSGNVVEGKNISKFCRENNLSITDICLVLKGKRSFSKGYRKFSIELIGIPFDFSLSPVAIESGTIRKLINPNGEVIEFTEVKNFCKENNLNVGNVYKLQHNLIKAAKGWRPYEEKYIGVKYIKEGRPKHTKQTKDFSFISPEGILIKGNNVAQFAKENDLSRASIFSLRNGKFKQLKGWTLYKEKT